MRASTLSVVLLLAAAAAGALAQENPDFYLLLEDGSKVTYGDLRALSGPNRACCFPAPWKFPVAYSNSPALRLFISKSGCEAGTEINSSAYPSLVGYVDLCAKGCDMSKGCGVDGMNVKGVSVKGGKIPIDKGAACGDSTGRLYQDKTCKAVANNGNFAYRLLCKQDCSGAYTCQEPSFDRSKCSGVGAVTTYVNLGEKCGYTQDNKNYVCGGNKVSCTNGVCTSSYPNSG